MLKFLSILEVSENFPPEHTSFYKKTSERQLKFKQESSFLIAEAKYIAFGEQYLPIMCCLHGTFFDGIDGT